MRASPLLAAFTMSLAGMACNRDSPKGDATAPYTLPTASMKHVPIAVTDDGFSPSEVKVKKGEPLMLMFKRTGEKTCATAVEFPELKLKKDLPLNQAVMVEIPTSESRVISFQCGMGMYKSSVVIQ